MKLNFCTLFNSAYLSRGLVLYDSLVKNSSDFHLYVYAFDETCFQFLQKLSLPDLTVISLKEFENEALLKVKKERSAAEYCWTCSASTIYDAITRFQLQNCTYIDADMLFYADPAILIGEMGSKSVLITEHRYSKPYDQSLESGKYCVQFVTFLNDEKGMNTLKWWKDSCIEWCFARVENGKFGDQKYLDEFDSKFGAVHVLQYLGGGLAPWNIQQYDFVKRNDKIEGVEKSTGIKFEPVFFHFHGLKFFENNMVLLTGEFYEILPENKHLFFLPYLELLNKKALEIRAIDSSFNPNGNAGISPKSELNALVYLKIYLSELKRSPGNLFGKSIKNRLNHYHFIRNKRQ